MKKETALKRISNALKPYIKGESEKVQKEVIDHVYEDFKLFEQWDSEMSSTENLQFAIGNVFEILNELIKEAKESK